MSTEVSTTRKDSHSSLEGKYIIFSLGQEKYGLEILKVQEIIGLMHMTKVPRTLEYIKGVINLRGKIIPIIDLRLKLGLDEVPPTEKTCIIVVQVELQGKNVQIGLIVDTVLEVLQYHAKDLEPAPDYGSTLTSNVIVAMARNQGGEVTILIDAVKTLSDVSVIETDK